MSAVISLPSPRPDRDPIDAKTGRTREGLTPYDLRIYYEIDAAMLAQSDPKPALIDMHAWVDFQVDAIMASARHVALVDGTVQPHHARQLAIGRRLLDFIARCLEHEEDLTTMFRAKAHKDRRKK